MTAAQVEASLNRKNVEVVQGDRSAMLLPGDAVDALGDVGAEADDAWVPDQETGVFVPAEEAAGSGSVSVSGADGPHEQPGPSVLDQAVFVREDLKFPKVTASSKLQEFASQVPLRPDPITCITF